jgi:hypothetical protein
MLYSLGLQNAEEHVHLDSSGNHQTIVVRFVWLPVEIVKELELMIVCLANLDFKLVEQLLVLVSLFQLHQIHLLLKSIPFLVNQISLET